MQQIHNITQHNDKQSMIKELFTEKFMNIVEFEKFVFSIPKDEKMLGEGNTANTYRKKIVNKCIKFASMVPRQTMMKIISYAAGYVKPFMMKLYGDMFEAIFTNDTTISYHNDFINYLYVRGVINKSNIKGNRISPLARNRTAKDMENVFKEGSLFDIVRKDDLDAMISYVADAMINNASNNILSTKIVFMETFASLIDVAAYCGSVKVFKYLLLNKVPVTTQTIEFSIKGGDSEIIHILEQCGYSFKNMNSIAINCHNNDIAKWLSQHFTCREITIPDCVKCWNLEAFCYLIVEEGHDIRETNHNGRTALDRAREIGDQLLIESILKLTLKKHKFNAMH